jgi:D-aminopeptidase
VPRPRARELGVTIGRLPPGRLNALTDVPGVRVGQVSLVSGEGPLRPGSGPIRTGVTAIWTHPGDPFLAKTPCAAFVLNGFGKTAGLAQVTELGVVETPILLTNTRNVQIVADALIDYLVERNPAIASINPVVGECNDSYLNDIRGRHVCEQHVIAALDDATPGPIAEGAVGAGVGMSCFELKGGIGTASRLVPIEGRGHVVGALVLTNFGSLPELRIDGVPVGQELADERRRGAASGVNPPGSCMIVVGTDIPLDARQLGRVARRAALGLARTGSIAGNGSGDFIIAFSNANLVFAQPSASFRDVRVLAEDGPSIDQVFQATVDSVEEAILNSLFRAETVVGRDGHVREALPIERVMGIMRRNGRER